MTILNNIFRMSIIWYFISSFLMLVHYSDNINCSFRPYDINQIIRILMIMFISWAGNYTIKNSKPVILKNFFIIYTLSLLAIIIFSFSSTEMFKISLYLTIFYICSILYVYSFGKKYMRTFRR